MKKNKKLIVLGVLAVIVLVAAGTGSYYVGLIQGKKTTKDHNVVTCMQDFNLEKGKTDSGVLTNPMENLPEVNPFEKVKTNPFE